MHFRIFQGERTKKRKIEKYDYCCSEMILLRFMHFRIFQGERTKKGKPEKI